MGRLVELDLAFLGPRVIVAEYGVGVAGSLLLGFLSVDYAMRNALSLRSWPALPGLELVAIGFNYMPLLLEALRRRADEIAIQATKAAIRDDPGEARSYGIRQAWILVPAAVVLFALIDPRRSAASSGQDALTHSGEGNQISNDHDVVESKRT